MIYFILSLVVCAVWLAIELYLSPSGYEDLAGFHYLPSEEKPAKPYRDKVISFFKDLKSKFRRMFTLPSLKKLRKENAALTEKLHQSWQVNAKLEEQRKQLENLHSELVDQLEKVSSQLQEASERMKKIKHQLDDSSIMNIKLTSRLESLRPLEVVNF